MELREAHASARDAVRDELDLERDLGLAFVQKWNLFEARTRARNKDEYLLRPDLGRFLSGESRAQVSDRCSRGHDLQILIGDGLSVTAVSKQVPSLLSLLIEGARDRQWNEIGELLEPRVAVLLIGERPGLATSESLSAYMAYQPRSSHTDANRNLVANIHARSVSPEQAALRILNLAAVMMKTRSSGCLLKEELPTLNR
jgi:ethanolamine ammonia-lyase small subunit